MEQLEVKDLAEIKEDIWGARKKWYEIGLQLKLIATDLEVIEADYQSTDRRFSEMLLQWLKKGKNCTWRAIIDALSSHPVGEDFISACIEKKYCPKKLKVNDDSEAEVQPPKSQDFQAVTPAPGPIVIPTSGQETKSVVDNREQLYWNDNFKPREYQKELADPGIEGRNYILVAPTGTGKTLIAGYVIMHHLNKMREGCGKGKVAFMTPTRHLTSQQKIKLQQYIQGIRAVDITGKSDKAMQPLVQSDEVDVIVCTAGKLLQELRKGTKITDFSLVVADECHHAGHCSGYTYIMEIYIRLKVEDGVKSLPQVIGMTAFPGAGKGKTSDFVSDHLESLCATLDATAGIFTVRKNDDELKAIHNSPKTYLKVGIERDPNDKFIVCVTSAMQQLESVISNDPCRGRGIKEHELWLQRKKEAGESEHLVLSQLEVYLQSLLTYQDYQYDDAIGVLREFQHQFSPSLNTEVMRKINGVHSDLMKKLADIQKIPNPMLEGIGSILHGQFSEVAASRGILFVEEAKHTEYISNWIKSTPSLSCKIRVERIAGSSHMVQSEQNRVLDGFRNDTYNLLASTAVLEEGFDVPQCNFIIRYQKFSNDIAQVQTKGRARAENSKVTTVVSPNSRRDLCYFFQEQKECLVGQSILQLQERVADFDQCVFQKQKCFVKEWDRKKKEIQNHRREWSETEDIEVLCGQCGVLACKGSDIFTYSLSSADPHYVIPNDTFSNRFRKEKHDDPQVSKDFTKPYRIFCAAPSCGRQWGIIGNWSETNFHFPALKCESFSFRYKDKMKTWKKWKKRCFEVKDIFEWDEFDEDIIQEQAS